MGAVPTVNDASLIEVLGTYIDKAQNKTKAFDFGDYNGVTRNWSLRPAGLEKQWPSDSTVPCRSSWSFACKAVGTDLA